MNSFSKLNKFDSSFMLFIGMLAAILCFLLMFSFLLHDCSETIIRKGTVLNGFTVKKDTSYNTLAKMGLVFGPEKIAGSSASCR
jgi:hypothetical protein